MARSSLIVPVGTLVAATFIFASSAEISLVVAFLNGTTTVKVPSMFSWKSRIRIAFAWAELVPGTESDVVSRPESRDAESAPTTMMATHMEMTTTRRLMTRRLHRSNTLEAYSSRLIPLWGPTSQDVQHTSDVTLAILSGLSRCLPRKLLRPSADRK